jgi:hypothetical protein
MVQQRQNEAMILVSTAEIVVSSSWGSDFVATRWMSENQSHKTFMVRKCSMTRTLFKYQFHFSKILSKNSVNDIRLVIAPDFAHGVLIFDTLDRWKSTVHCGR